MQLGQIEWKQKGKKAHRLHGIFPYLPELEQNPRHLIDGKPTYILKINGHVVARGLGTLEIAQKYAEEWLLSAMANLANTMQQRIIAARNPEFSNEQNVRTV